VKKGDYVIDATCGRGKDTLFLARQALTPESGRVVSMDIQQVALDSAKELLNKEIPEPSINKRIELIKMSHEQIESYITPSLKLITYNLGYLPGGDKSIVTQTSSTMKSLRSATHILPIGSWISITCYPGHSEGSKEEKDILEWIKTLPVDHWTVFMNSWPNNTKNGPSLILLEKLVPHSMRKAQ
jgi:hypothetical protein